MRKIPDYFALVAFMTIFLGPIGLFAVLCFILFEDKPWKDEAEHERVKKQICVHKLGSGPLPFD